MTPAEIRSRRLSLIHIYMPIKIQSDLPVKEILEKENIFVMDEGRAVHQDIRPIRILILNLMPLKEETELQLLRSLSNTPLQVDVSFMMVATHESKNTATSHLNKFYETFDQVKAHKYDGMIITGAPVEQMEFEEVDYWEELKEIMEWTKTNVTSTIYLCWAAQAGLYYHYGLKKMCIRDRLYVVKKDDKYMIHNDKNDTEVNEYIDKTLSLIHI